MNSSSRALPVLVVEDDPADARLIRDALTGSEDGPFHVEWVTRLSDALERLGDDVIEAVLLDLTLPDSQGIEALEKLTRGENHLVGCLAAAALAPHAVGDHSQRTARDTRMRDDFDLILLVVPITPMLARRGHEAIALLGRAHGRKL